MDPVSMLMNLTKVVTEALNAAQTNKETSERLSKHIKRVMNSAYPMLKEKAEHKEELRAFIKEMTKILEDTQKITKRIKKSLTLTNMFKNNTDNEDLQEMITRLDYLQKDASFLALAKLYEGTHIHEAKLAESWELPHEKVCLFCHVTKDGNYLIGGQRTENGVKRWQLGIYDNKGHNIWEWRCPEDLGEPSDVAQIGEKYLAILVEDQNKIELFDRRKECVVNESVYKLNEQDYRLRHIIAPDSDTLVISMDPTIVAKPSVRSQLKVLEFSKSSFHESSFRPIQLECLDTHSLSPLHADCVAVACGMPESVCVYDVHTGHPKWHLEPTQMGGTEVVPEIVCAVGADLCVYDTTGTRIVTSSGGTWGKILLRKANLGDLVYSMTYNTDTKQLVVLHEKEDLRRISIFDLSIK